jgi:LysM repeat protein
MKVPHLFRRKKLFAAAARRSSVGSAEMDLEEVPEPNMKLSRALLIVLLLHVVAVSGIIAFNAIKTREGTLAAPQPDLGNKSADTTAAESRSSAAATPRPAAAPKAIALGAEAKPSHVPAKSPVSKPQRSGSPVSSGKVYIVKKGDNPVTIARKLKVSYDDLMALNHIEDPRKLRVGQKLLIPKTPAAKTASAKATNLRQRKKNERHGGSVRLAGKSSGD